MRDISVDVERHLLVDFVELLFAEGVVRDASVVGQYVLHSEFFLEAGYLILEFANEILMVGER